MSKHYIRKDENNCIVKVFSDAFEKPEQNDICVEENGGRHYHLDILDADGNYKYKWENEKISNRTEAEKYNIEKEKTRKIAELKNNILKKLVESDQEYINKKQSIDGATNKTELEEITI